MSEYALYLVRSSVCLGLLYVIYMVVLGRVNRPALRRWVLMISASLSLVVPLVQVEIPRKVFISSEHPSGLILSGSQVSGDDAALPAPAAFPDAGLKWAGPGAAIDDDAGVSHTAGKVAGAVYFSGVAAVLASVAMSISGLYSIKGRRFRLGRKRRAVLVIAGDSVAPMSWFGRICIGRNDFSEAGRQIVMHELEHAGRLHSLDMLFAGVIVSMQWFNPFAWLFRRELSAVHEYEVDRSMIEKNIDVIRYVQLLLAKATGDAPGLANGFRHSIIKNRIAMITRKKSPGRTVLLALYLVPFTCLGTVAFAQWKTVPVFTESGMVNMAAAPGAECPSVPDTLKDMTGMTVNGEKVISDRIVKFPYSAGEKALVFLPRGDGDHSSEAELTVIHGQYKPGRPGEEKCYVDNLVETLAATDSMCDIAVFCYPETMMGVLKDVSDVLENAFPDCRLTVHRNLERKVTRAFVDDVSGIDRASFRQSGDFPRRGEMRDKTVVVRCNDEDFFFIAFSADDYLVSSDPDEVLEFCEKAMSEAAPGTYTMINWGCDRITSFGPMDRVLSWFMEKGLEIEMAFDMKDTSAIN